MSQIVRGCTPKYIVWRRQEMEDIVLLPVRMQVSISDLAPIQPSEVEIVKSEFAFERLEMKQKYFRL